MGSLGPAESSPLEDHDGIVCLWTVVEHDRQSQELDIRFLLTVFPIFKSHSNFSQFQIVEDKVQQYLFHPMWTKFESANGLQNLSKKMAIDCFCGVELHSQQRHLKHKLKALPKWDFPSISNLNTCVSCLRFPKHPWWIFKPQPLKGYFSCTISHLVYIYHILLHRVFHSISR